MGGVPDPVVVVLFEQLARTSAPAKTKLPIIDAASLFMISPANNRPLGEGGSWNPQYSPNSETGSWNSETDSEILDEVTQLLLDVQYDTS